MLLVDSLYVNYGGALSLLNYLVERLQERNVVFFLLADARCKGLYNNVPYVEYCEAKLSERKNFYLNHTNYFSSVFCFGNVPPPVKLNVPIYVYFHNINMLTLANCRDWKQKMMFWLKRTYISLYRKNTDEWFVQTSNTASALAHSLGISKERIKQYPFYMLPPFENDVSVRTEYIFVGEYSGSKGHDELLEAWKLLHQRGMELTLHLTVSLGDRFLKELDKVVSDGVKIVNHGYVSFAELSKLYMQSKATIYPSYDESFGLGLVEAMEAGCDVVASNRDFVYAICKPSEVFEPQSPESIADAVFRYESGKSQKTTQVVRNKIDEMIDEIDHE